jgi:hypothetical protein
MRRLWEKNAIRSPAIKPRIDLIGEQFDWVEGVSWCLGKSAANAAKSVAAGARVLLMMLPP